MDPLKQMPGIPYRSFCAVLALILLAACGTQPTPAATPTAFPPATRTPAPTRTAVTTRVPFPTITPAVISTPKATQPTVPIFDHITVILFENKEFTSVVDNPQMPIFNRLARQNVLLTGYYAIRHPSLPNYLALIGGSTFGVETNCEDCFFDAQTLPDLVEASGRTWKTYQESMPRPCFMGSTAKYAQKHNPFVYFDPIRLDEERCRKHVVPLTDLENDLQTGQLPNLIWIEPDICNSGHDCDLDIVDQWLGEMLNRLQSAPELSKNSLIFIAWEEGQGEHTCCGLTTGGGRVAAVLISDKARAEFEDSTPYTHYSFLRTISDAWGLPLLEHAANPQTAPILKPWK